MNLSLHDIRFKTLEADHHFAMASSSSKEEIAKIRKSRSKKSVCFPSCFGSSGDESDSVKKKLPENGRSGKKMSLFSSSRFKIRQSGTKTVPVDAAIDEQTTRGRDVESEIQAVEEDMIGKSQISSDPDRSHAKIPTVDAVLDQSATEKSRKTKCRSGKQEEARSNTVGENLKDHAVPAKQETCRKTALFCRKIGTRKTGSQPGSPDNKQRRSTISSSTSFPQPGRLKPAQPVGVLRLSGTKSGRECYKKFDSMVGMSILMVILAVMLLGGRICAIICTSAWFYFLPRLRTAKISGTIAGGGSNPGILDVDSDEYKKKVILKGLLERNRRNPGGVL